MKYVGCTSLWTIYDFCICDNCKHCKIGRCFKENKTSDMYFVINGDCIFEGD